MNDPILPPARPLPADVRDRTLRTVLRAIDDGADHGPPGTGFPAARTRRGRWQLLAAAAAAVVVVGGSGVAVLAAAGSGGIDQLAPAAAPSTVPAQVDLPAPTGDPALDDALARCATAVVANGRAAEYPPTGEWTVSHAPDVPQAIHTELVVDGSFGCLTSPTSVAVSGTSGTPAGPSGVGVVRMSAGELLILNPDRHDGWVVSVDPGWGLALTETAHFVNLHGDETPDQLSIEIGEVATPLPAEPVQALTVVDRPLPGRPDGLEQQELAECMDRVPAHERTDPGLWRVVGRHDVSGAPPALVARIGEVAVGLCFDEPGRGQTFTAALAPGRDQILPVTAGGGGGVMAYLFAVTPDVTRVEVVAGDGSGPAPCTVADGLAVCTTDRDFEAEPEPNPPLVVSVYPGDSSAAPVEFTYE